MMVQQGCRSHLRGFFWLAALLLSWILTACSPSLPAVSPLLDDLHCQAVPGQPETRLCYLQPDFDYPTWFLQRGDSRYEVTVNAMGPMISSFSFSPSGNLLAVESTGEGHPLLDLYDSSHIRVENSIYYLESFDPYPGWVSVSGWDGETLLLEADVPLHQVYERTSDYDDSMIYSFRWSADAPELQLVSAGKSRLYGFLPTVYFDFDSLDIDPVEAEKLMQLIERLEDETDLLLSIEGHTDAVGSDDYNLDKGDRMAEAVQAYLVAHGVDSSRLRTSSYGEERPAASNETEEGRAFNRRVEILAWDGL